VPSGAPPLHDLACVVHLHSTFSDGTGTVPEIVRAARRAGVDVVLLTDHDTLAAREAGYEGWHDDVLLLVGEEVSPKGRDHYLAFGLEQPVDHRGMGPADIVRAVAEAGGFGFAAHPFSRGSERFRTKPMRWSDLDCHGLAGLEVWSFVTDEGERIDRLRDALSFLVHPDRFASGPPEENLREWDRLNASGRRVVGIGGLDAHQIGKRIADRFVVRLMGYARSFRQLRTHVLVEELPTGDLEHDREQVYAALREGRSYMALDSLAPARGFAFWVDDDRIRTRLPRPARIRLLHDGAVVHEDHGAELDAPLGRAGTYRIEASLNLHGFDQTWVVSNPLFMRNRA
jgi:PHP domain